MVLGVPDVGGCARHRGIDLFRSSGPRSLESMSSFIRDHPFIHEATEWCSLPSETTKNTIYFEAKGGLPKSRDVSDCSWNWIMTILLGSKYPRGSICSDLFTPSVGWGVSPRATWGIAALPFLHIAAVRLNCLWDLLSPTPKPHLRQKSPHPLQLDLLPSPWWNTEGIRSPLLAYQMGVPMYWRLQKPLHC